MKNQIEAKEKQVERLVGEAVAVAQRFLSAQVGSDHLLYVISGTEEGRRDIEDLGGCPKKVRRFLEGTFEDRARAGVVPTHSSLELSLQMSVKGPMEEARNSSRPLTLRSIVLMMCKLGDLCMTTRLALREGGLVDHLPSLTDEIVGGTASEDTQSDDEFPTSPDDWLTPDASSDDPANAFIGGTDASNAGAAGRPGNGAGRQTVSHGAEEVDEHHKAVVAAIRDLSADASRGKIDEVIGRADLIDQVADVLCRRRKRNVILAGEPGVGKTAIAEGLAHFLLSDKAPADLKGRPLLEVSIADIVSGTRFRGDFEARMRKLVDIARREKAILFMDEMHMVVGAGSGGQSGGMDASNILKPAMARGEISVVGATTPGEMGKMRKDGALMRRFEVIRVAEPSAAETRSIIDQAVAQYTLFHGVIFEDDVLDEVVSLSDKYLKQKRFPDKAFDLIDMSAVIAKRRGAQQASVDDLRRAVPRLGGVRLGKPDPIRVAKVKALGDALKGKIYGQNEAADALAKAARISLLGLQPGGTSGSYLLTGPTGVGKTAMVEAFAESLGLPLVRVSMSEFMEKHSVARLIGAPPGYVGYDEDGILTAAGDTHSEFVLLLDEIEKAHPDVFDVMLQVLDKGLIRAGDGREVSLVGAHVFLTSNLGAAEADKASIGFGRMTDAGEEADKAVKGNFRKEFLARIQATIQMKRIGTAAMGDIAKKELALATERLSDIGYEIEVEADVAELLAAGSNEDPYAVRSLQARIKDEVSEPLVKMLLSIEGDEKIFVRVEDGKIRVLATQA